MDAGATGVAVGRNVWQHSDPLSITQKLKEVTVSYTHLRAHET